MEVYMDEKWKLSKKGSRREQSRREQVQQQQQSLRRSASMPESLKRSRSCTTRANHQLQQSSSNSKQGASGSSKTFSGRCANLVKEQRAKFYIMRRCVTMLLCWRDYP